MGAKIYQFPLNEKVRLARQIVADCLKYNQRIPKFILELAGYREVV
ncbi:hypothetical protein [Halothermothrix orenii]|nr:hypothetical protein [Halothermothrix orenii]